MKSNSSIFLLTAIIALVTTLPGCKKDTDPPVYPPYPKADFVFKVDRNDKSGVRVTFTSTSQFAREYRWEFGDGTTATDSLVEHTYASVGIYAVTLVVKNQRGKDSITKTVDLTMEPPKAAFTFTLVNDGQLPCTVNFANTSSGAASSSWYFGDGDTSSQTDVQKTYSVNKTYLVKLVVANSAGRDSVIQEVTINPILHSVLVYLVTPKDKTFNQRYYDALKASVLSLRQWYKNQMGNHKTFVINPLVVDTLTGGHDSVWYNGYNGPFSGEDPRFYGYYNTYTDMQALLGSKFNTSQYTYLVYVAAPGGGAGTPGFCAMGDQDLKGLLGENEDNLNPNRWIGGGGHELGHAFGLPHPDNQNEQAIMWTGYVMYPDCILQDSDRAILNVSPFFR